MEQRVAATEPWWTVGRRVVIILVLVTVNMSIYLVLNHHPVRAPRLLPMTAVDRLLPFLPWTIWPYLLLLLADAVLPMLIRRDQTFRRMLQAFGVTVVLNITGWVLLPVTYPRPPLPVGDGWTLWGYRTLVGIDTPLNCFPSGHISVPAVLCWAVAQDRPAWRWPLWGAFALLAPSILTTKQHYAWDLVGGMAIAWMGIAVVRRWERRGPD